MDSISSSTDWFVDDGAVHHLKILTLLAWTASPTTALNTWTSSTRKTILNHIPVDDKLFFLQSCQINNVSRSCGRANSLMQNELNYLENIYILTGSDTICNWFSVKNPVHGFRRRETHKSNPPKTFIRLCNAQEHISNVFMTLLRLDWNFPTAFQLLMCDTRILVLQWQICVSDRKLSI